MTHLKILNKILISLVLVSFLAIIFFGLSSVGTKHVNGQMNDCPFTPGHTAICKMSLTEHIQEWQNIFTSTPTSLLLAALLTLFGLYMAGSRSLFLLTIRMQNHSHLFFVSILVFDPLKKAFSQGILHTKIY